MSQSAETTDRIRILRIIARMNIGGPAIHVTTLHARLDPARFDSMLVSGTENPGEGNMLGYARTRGVEPVIVPAMRGVATFAPRDVTTLARLIGIVRRFKPHIVDTHTAKAGSLGRVAARLCGVPVVVHTYHGHVLSGGYYGGLRTTLLRQMERGLAALTDRIIAVSHEIKKDLIELGIAAADRIAVVPLGIERDQFLQCDRVRGDLHRELNLSPDVPIVGIVGRIFPIKNHRRFLTAMAKVAAARTNARFLVVGDGVLRAEMEALARELGIGGQTVFTGWREDLDRIYADLSVLVVSSDNEGTPMSAIEAMASRVPVVATRVGGLPDLIEDGRTGFLLPASDVDGLAAAVTRLLSDAGRRIQMGEAARASTARFGADRLATDMDRLYRDLLSRKGIVATASVPVHSHVRS